jgi:ubiquinone/menaquinone biosynthesis C-methylase UbiE
MTDGLFNRINIQKGWKVLDAGSGPGFVSMDLRERVGDKGEVTALEPSEVFLNYFSSEADKRGWHNVKFVNGTAEAAPLPGNYFDFIFSRGVIGFVPDPDLFISKLIESLAPGGIIAIEDYAFNRLFLYPKTKSYEQISPAAMKFWESEGGDLCIAPRIPSIYKKHGLELMEFHPNCIAGGPESGIFEWHNRFLTFHVPVMVQKGLMTEEDGEAALKDWHDHCEDPSSVFFSPLVVDVVGKKKS